MARRGLITTLLVAAIACGCGGGGTDDGGASPTTAPAAAAPPVVTTSPPVTPPTSPPPANREPIVAKPIPIQRGVARHTFSYEFTQSGTTFADPDGDALTYDSWVTYRSSSEPGSLTVVGTTVSGVLSADGWIEVDISAKDGRGPSTPHKLTIVIDPNSPPIVANPNLAVMTAPGAPIHHDPVQGGTTFRDPDGDLLRYETRVLSDPKGLAIAGLDVVGRLNAVGMVSFEVTARDDYGGSNTDRFAIAIAAPEPGAPTLPATRFVYADEELPLPSRFRDSSQTILGPFWNMTPGDNLITNAGATLGRVLFYDKRLSITNTHSCGSCHEQAKSFAGSVRFATGVQGLPMRRNSMALSNVRFNFPERWFSDLRAQSLEDLALMPIEEPTELGYFLPSLEKKLAATTFYPPLFAAAFGTPDVTADRISKALAQFLRSMMTYRAKYDRAYIDGIEPVPGVLTPQEARGEGLFRGNLVTLCAQCHIQEIQTIHIPDNNGLDAVFTDPGAGRGVFRPASLRNIAVTAPYMHDGRFATLREVIEHYDHGIQDSPELSSLLRDPFSGQVKRMNFSEADKQALEAFLHTLTDHEFLNDPKFADPFL